MNKQRIFVFLLCYFSYTTLHISRTSWAFCQDEIEKDWAEKVAKIIISYVDFCFMLGYALGLFINGNWGDKLNPRYFYGSSLLTTAVIYLVLFFVDLDHVTSPLAFKVIMFMGGLI